MPQSGACRRPTSRPRSSTSSGRCSGRRRLSWPRGAPRSRRAKDLSEATVREALERLDPLWDELFPAEQARIVQLLVQRVDLKPDGLELRLRTQGLGHGFGAICMASMAGVITPGGPMVSVPLLVVLSNSGMALGPLVAYMTAWSLFGMQRIIAWEAPLMGWHFVAVRTASSLVFPIVAGWLVNALLSRVGARAMAFADLREFIAHLEKHGLSSAA